MSMIPRPELDREWSTDREMLRSTLISLFWSVISEKRGNEDYTLQQLADALRVDKSAVSRWFTGRPNWTINTIADIAHALDLELHVTGTHRPTGVEFAADGPLVAPQSRQIEIRRDSTSTYYRRDADLPDVTSVPVNDDHRIDAVG